jgi:hypothetical protein
VLASDALDEVRQSELSSLLYIVRVRSRMVVVLVHCGLEQPEQTSEFGLFSGGHARTGLTVSRSSRGTLGGGGQVSRHS